jgi:hypothetical protein
MEILKLNKCKLGNFKLTSKHIYAKNKLNLFVKSTMINYLKGGAGEVAAAQKNLKDKITSSIPEYDVTKNTGTDPTLHTNEDIESFTELIIKEFNKLLVQNTDNPDLFKELQVEFHELMEIDKDLNKILRDTKDIYDTDLVENAINVKKILLNIQKKLFTLQINIIFSKLKKFKKVNIEPVLSVFEKKIEGMNKYMNKMYAIFETQTSNTTSSTTAQPATSASAAAHSAAAVASVSAAVSASAVQAANPLVTSASTTPAASPAASPPVTPAAKPPATPPAGKGSASTPASIPPKAPAAAAAAPPPAPSPAAASPGGAQAASPAVVAVPPASAPLPPSGASLPPTSPVIMPPPPTDPGELNKWKQTADKVMEPKVDKIRDNSDFKNNEEKFKDITLKLNNKIFKEYINDKENEDIKTIVDIINKNLESYEAEINNYYDFSISNGYAFMTHEDDAA